MCTVPPVPEIGHVLLLQKLDKLSVSPASCQHLGGLAIVVHLVRVPSLGGGGREEGGGGRGEGGGGLMVTIIIALCHSLTRVFSRDILKGGNIGVLASGRGVLGVYYLLENIIHYYYCQSEGGEDSSQGGPPFPPPPPPTLENTLRSSFHQNFEETKGYSPGLFFSGSEKMC